MTKSSIFWGYAKLIFPAFQRKIVAVRGLEHLPSGGCLLVANHVDWLDGFYIVTAIGTAKRVPVYFLSKSNAYWWTTIVIQIPPRNREAIIDIASAEMHQGKMITTFPEGRRNPTEKLLPGKTGAVRIAAKAGLPIVPLGITCSAGENMTQSLQYLFSKEHPVKIAIGEPMTVVPPASGVTPEWLEQETQRVMAAIASLAGKTV